MYRLPLEAVGRESEAHPAFVNGVRPDLIRDEDDYERQVDYRFNPAKHGHVMMDLHFPSYACNSGTPIAYYPG